MTGNETDGTDHVTEARQMAIRTIEDWEYLSDEQKHGTLHQIVHQLSKADSEQKLDTGDDGGV